MLTSYPYQINNVSIPFPTVWDETPKRIQSEFETEAGGRKVIKARSARLRVSASFTVSSRWLKKFMLWRDEDSLTVGIYDARTGSRQTHTMDISAESFTYSFIPGTQRMSNTDGLYELSFEMEEF